MDKSIDVWIVVVDQMSIFYMYKALLKWNDSYLILYVYYILGLEYASGCSIYLEVMDHSLGCRYSYHSS